MWLKMFVHQIRPKCVFQTIKPLKHFLSRGHFSLFNRYNPSEFLIHVQENITFYLYKWICDFWLGFINPPLCTTISTTHDRNILHIMAVYRPPNSHTKITKTSRNHCGRNETNVQGPMCSDTLPDHIKLVEDIDQIWKDLKTLFFYPGIRL